MPAAASPASSYATLTRPIPGNAVRNTFTDEDALQAMLKDFEGAQSKIQFESFLFNGAHGEKLANVFIKKAKQGVPVQVLLDGKQSKAEHEMLANKMRAAGVDVRYYNTKQLKHGAYAVEHAKVSVIDDKIAWDGGANFDREINRDMMTRVEGPAVRRFQDTFHQGWQNAGGTVLPVKGKLTPQGDVWIGVSQTGPQESTTRQQVIDELRATGRGDAIDLWMMDLGDPQVLQELLAAKARGANVRALLDPEVPFVAESTTLKDRAVKFIAKGAPDLNAIKQLQKNDIPVRYYDKPAGISKLHAKVWVFTHGVGTPDETLRTIGGSVNAIKSAYDFNHEVGFLMYGGDSGHDVKAAFTHDFEQQSAAIPKLGFWDNFRVQFVKMLTKHLI